MANEEQLSILKQGVEVWNRWRAINSGVLVDLSGADIRFFRLKGADLAEANLSKVSLGGADLRQANLTYAILTEADLSGSFLMRANLRATILRGANLSRTELSEANLRSADVKKSTFTEARVDFTLFGNLDLSESIGLENVQHGGPSNISTDTFVWSRGNISERFLRGCGLSDWEIEMVKLYNPELGNEERNRILYRIYDLQSSQAIQISPLFISYSHADGTFVDKIENQLNKRGVRFWRDIHDMKSGRMEKQIDRAIRQNPTVLLVLSENSLNSDWVEHEARTARGLEKEAGRDVLCPVALDDSWKSSSWPKRLMEQIMEYNILDFSEWEDDARFEGIFRKLIDGLELFYKG